MTTTTIATEMADGVCAMPRHAERSGDANQEMVAYGLLINAFFQRIVRLGDYCSKEDIDAEKE